jgi:hypothetical protein
VVAEGRYGHFSWVERLQPYVDRWATALDNLVEEVWPHDDTVWEAYIQWYTPRTQARVMYVPPQPAAPLPDTTRFLASTAYPVRRDKFTGFPLWYFTFYNLLIISFAVRHDCRPFTYCRGLDGEAGFLRTKRQG